MSEYIDIYDKVDLKHLIGRKVWVNPDNLNGCSDDYRQSAGKIGTVYDIRDKYFLCVKFPDGTTMNGAGSFRFKLVTSKLERALK